MGYTLLTNIAQEHHLAILDDWLEFLGTPPAAINAVLPENPELASRVAEFCQSRSVPFVQSAVIFDRAAMANESIPLMDQMKFVSTDWAFIVRLDTFPFRSGHATWLSDAINKLEQGSYPFMTGSTRTYRADKTTDNQSILQTQRISNNTLLVDPKFWIEVLEHTIEEGQLEQNIFFAEASVERYCAKSDVWGLRKLNSPDWRVFHVQAWGPEQTEMRRLFREGHRIGEYMSGFEDDFNHPWDRYYLSPKPSIYRRAKIHLGRFRRDFASSVLPKHR